MVVLSVDPLAAEWAVSRAASWVAVSVVELVDEKAAW